ncbi:trypsin family [Volvox carteri f. nagariensis]|uniref:Trypsin family n=1 Tax=Volvox carteri f. nagariensis TaxID=3068 RepID=D8UC26_VOLCA|nr:trypsin family [Volvox carteri f. nagariensis]EFJ42722.1 trypsin family [Volvox carteri f. nagariensis]|eukprot:XP_002956183.1 trypsin family [Volvox carteri f. nagariensis]
MAARRPWSVSPLRLLASVVVEVGRILLARCAALCAASTLAGVPFFARPSVAAALVDEDIAVQVFQDVSPSVVSIAVLRSVGGVQVRDVIGSGVVWDAAGPHVLTNFHIIPPLQGTNTVLEVTLQDMATGAYSILPARVAGSDSLHDLAVLKLLLPQQQPQPQSEEVLGSQLSVARDPASSDGVSNGVSNANGVPVVVAPIRVAAPGDLRVGQLVYALGCVAANPAAAAPTRSLSVGLISGLGRSIPSPVGARIYGVVQCVRVPSPLSSRGSRGKLHSTEAVVNAANSGGPLVDSAGRMVGLSTAVGAAQTGTARGSGVNFALPVDLLLDVVPKIIVYGNPYGKK